MFITLHFLVFYAKYTPINRIFYLMKFTRTTYLHALCVCLYYTENSTNIFYKVVVVAASPFQLHMYVCVRCGLKWISFINL